jgi:hypothetical protein
MATIRNVINVLRSAERLGPGGLDDPEGVRYIQISDTLAAKMADDLEAYLTMTDPGAVRCPVCGVDMRDRMETFGLLE